MPLSALRRSLVSGAFALIVVAVCAGGLSSVQADSQTVQAVESSAPITPAPPPAATAAVADEVDGPTLEAALADAGVDLPEGASVYAVRIDETGAGTAYEAGEGAGYAGFWPASSVKLLAAVGALEYLADLGFTGEARVTMDGETFTVADVYEQAIADSSNEAYDQLVRIAGVDWLNERFLTAANGFGDTVIQRSYTGWGVDVSRTMTVVEDGRRLTVPARRASGSYGCEDDGNCSTLLDLTESVRRVTLDAELPDEERFDIAPADVAGLADALLASEGFVEPAVSGVLGDQAHVYNKPGYVPGDECVDVAMVSQEAAGERYLLAVETPEDGWMCPGLVEIAIATLEFLQQVQG
jgi:hypothetical protein